MAGKQLFELITFQLYLYVYIFLSKTIAVSLEADLEKNSTQFVLKFAIIHLYWLNYQWLNDSNKIIIKPIKSDQAVTGTTRSNWSVNKPNFLNSTRYKWK